MKKPLFNADDAEEYFSSLCVFYRETANGIFKRDNDGRHPSEQIYSAEYQKYIGMQIAMREVLEYFSKFELIHPQKTNVDHIRAMSDEELARFINTFNICDTRTSEECKISYCGVCGQCVLDWLQQPAEEV